VSSLGAPYAALFFAPKATAVTYVGWNLGASHVLSTSHTVILLATEATAVAYSCWDAGTSHVVAALDAVVLLAAETAAVADVSRVEGHLKMY
jgi:hypothetical protein